MAPPVLVLSLEERIRRFGVLCAGPVRKTATGEWTQSDGIVFRGGEWEPGGEYVQKLTVKNVTTKMKKLKYRLPSTRYFALAYPETIELSPGMSCDIDVVFRPLHREAYDDTIYFKLEEPMNGDARPRGFHVPVRAALSKLEASVPTGLDFGLCATNELSERNFEMTNTGQVPAPFQWRVPKPFLLEPEHGVIDVGASVVMTASLRPTRASVFVAQATCEIGAEVTGIEKPEPVLEMRFSAIGKYAHVIVSDKRLDFGEILAGTPATSEDVVREITVQNTSVVPATVAVVRSEADCESLFAVSPRHFVVPPLSEQVVNVTFHARAWGTFAAETYKFITPGGNAPELLLTGSAVPPVVSILKKEDPYAKGLGVPNSVNFGNVEVGATVNRALFLKNNSDRPVAFQFAFASAPEGGASFTVSQREGIIPANLEVPVKLVFYPLSPIHYARRIFILVQHRAPLFVDVLGTAFVAARGEVKEQRPHPLRHAHLQAFRNRAAAGLATYSPDDLDAMHADLLEQQQQRQQQQQNNNNNKSLEKKEVAAADAQKLFAHVGLEGHAVVLRQSRVARPLTRTGEATRDEIAPAVELFQVFAEPDDDASVPEIGISTTTLDLGACRANAAKTPKRTVTLTNKTRGKVSVHWRAPVVADSSAADGGSSEEASLSSSSSDFFVHPPTADVAAGESMDFRVEFSPSRANCSCCAELEALVAFKSARSFRLVNDATLSPPWSLSVTATGHSFVVDQQFAARVTLEPATCCFPATYVGDSTFQTLKLTNRSNLPATYAVKRPDARGIFALEPRCGMIRADSFQLVVARFTPRTSRTHELPLELTVNGLTSRVGTLVGHGHTPSVEVRGLSSNAVVTRGGDNNNVLNKKTGGSSLLSFQPTSLGLTSSRTFEVVNTSRVPLVYALALPKPVHDLNTRGACFTVQPRSGILRGKEKALVSVKFAPRHLEVQNAKLSLTIRALAGPPPPPESTRDARQQGDAAPAPILEKRLVRLVGPGSLGAVVFEPAVLEYPTILVNMTESKALILTNGSDCAVAYSIEYVDKSTPTGGGGGGEMTDGVIISPGLSSSSSSVDGHLTAEKPPSPPPRALVLSRRPMTAASALNKQRIVVDAPSGILAARSRKRVKVTFQPDAAGDFEFACVCKVRAVDEAGRPTDLEAEDAALLTTFGGTVGGVRDDDDETLRRKKNDDAIKDLALECTIKGRASFPTVVIQDVRLIAADGAPQVGCSTEQLWTHFSVRGINETLLRPLTRFEVALNSESSPDLAVLERFPVRFVPEPYGSAAQVVVIALKNPGSLATKFEIHLPNEKDVELEPWADEGAPTAAEVRINRIIDELKCFEVTPQSGELGPGETATLRFCYAFTSRDLEGHHVLPILLKIDQGKQVWLDLEGRTLGPREPYLVVAADPRSNALGLAPVAVGTAPPDTPVHDVEIANVSAVDVEFSLDYKQPRPVDEKLRAKMDAAEDLGMDLLDFERPAGVIAAHSAIRLKARFLPLMPRAYTAECTLNYRTAPSRFDNDDDDLTDNGGGGDQALAFVVEMRGYNAAVEDPWATTTVDSASSKALNDNNDSDAAARDRQVALFSSPPAHQIIDPPAHQVAVLSYERLDFGRLPQRAYKTQVITIRPRDFFPSLLSDDDDVDAPLVNNSTNKKKKKRPKKAPAYEFQWEASHDLVERGIVEISPLSGTIAGPSDVAIIRISVRAECEPTQLRASILVLVREKQQQQQQQGSLDRSLSSSASVHQASGASSSSKKHEGLVTRCTVSRERSLTQTTLPHNRLPMMPTSSTAVEASIAGGTNPHEDTAATSESIISRAQTASAALLARQSSSEVSRSATGVPNHHHRSEKQMSSSNLFTTFDNTLGGGGGGGTLPVPPGGHHHHQNFRSGTARSQTSRLGNNKTSCTAKGGGASGVAPKMAAHVALFLSQNTMGHVVANDLLPPPFGATMGSVVAMTDHGDDDLDRAFSLGETHRYNLTPKQEPPALACFCRLTVVGEIVAEAQFLELHGGAAEIGELFIPRPLTFIPPSDQAFSLTKKKKKQQQQQQQAPDDDDEEDEEAAIHDAKAASVGSHQEEDPRRRSPEEEDEEDVRGATLTKEREKTLAVRLAMCEIFDDVLKLHEVRSVFAELSVKPVVPYYSEHKKKRKVYEKIFGRLDADADGVLTCGELDAGLVKLGVKAATAEVKAFFRALRADPQAVVNCAAWYDSLSPTVHRALQEAVDTCLHAEAVALQAKREEARRLNRRPPPAEKIKTADSAATAIAALARSKQARAMVTIRARDDDGDDDEAKKQHKKNKQQQQKQQQQQQQQHTTAAASKIQSIARSRATQSSKARLEDDRRRKDAQKLLATPTFQRAVRDTLEATLFNILSEALHDEFDLSAHPVQRLMPLPSVPPN